MTALPKGWALTTVGEAMSVAYGKSLEQRLRTDDGKYHYVGSGGPIASTDERLTFGETIVVGRKGTAGSVQRFPQGCWPSDTTFFIEVPDGFSGALIEHQLRSAQLAQHDRSTALPGLGRSDLESTLLTVPPLAEQERIITTIDEAFSKLDAGEAGLRTVRQLLKRMRDAILTAAVTGRLVPQDPTDTPAAKLLADLGVEALEVKGAAVLPPGWVWGRLGDLSLTVRNGVFVSRPAEAPPGVPILRIGAVRPLTLDWSDVRYAPVDINDPTIARGLLAEGDLLFTRYNGNPAFVGACALAGRVPGPVLHPDKLIRVAIDRRAAEPAFVAIAASTGWSRAFISAATKTTAGQAGISGGELKQVPVPLAPLSEQVRIVAEVERQLSFVDACDRAVDVGLSRSTGLRRSVLKAAFEGRLVPQDPSDEPASVLLDRIRAECSAQPAAKRRARKKV